MLIPMRIVLATDNYTHGLFDDYKVSMEEIHRVLGGATGYAKAVESYNRTPKFKDYSYGPTLSIDGLVVNGTKLEHGEAPELELHRPQYGRRDWLLPLPPLLG